MSRRKIFYIWLIVFSPLIGLVSIIGLTALGLFGSLPTFERLENPKSNLATEILSEDGVVLGTFFFENRSNSKYHELPPHLINALIATEDVRYLKHSGIDFRSLGRAVFGLVLGRESSGGASTITQQLAKMLFTEKPSSGVQRVIQKFKEWVIAIRLEKQYTKEEILAMYLNRFDWINNAVGIKTAARVYFNKSPEKLTEAECAMLIGMLKNPSLYNPNRRLELTTNRRNVVLSQMKKYDFITDSLYDTLVHQPIVLHFTSTNHTEGLASYFREYLRREMQKWCDTHYKKDGTPYNLYTDGIKIYTTINSNMQKYAEEAMKTHMSALQKDFYAQWKNYNKTKAPFPNNFSMEQIDEILDQGMRRSDRYKRLKKKGKSEKEIRKIFNKKVPMTLFSWQREIDTILSPRDSILYNKFFIHTGMMSMDPTSGHVKAYVGGIDYKYFQYDHVIDGKRQVGSTFKPILYALALQEGFSPCDKVKDAPILFKKDQWGIGSNWVPKNSDGKFSGSLLSLKSGLANSVNSVSAFIMSQFGPEAIVDMAKNLGIQTELNPVPSLCLGTFDLSVYEMVGVYSTFVNEGIWTEPIFITKITDKDGVVLEEFTPKTREALNEQTALLMIRMLQGVVNNGTGRRLKYKYKLNNEIGGKTGTTQNNSDGWFMGITPDLVTGVWAGCEDRSVHFRSTALGQGANMALPFFAEYMKRIYDDKKNCGIYPTKFEVPSSIDSIMNCTQGVYRGESVGHENKTEMEEL